MFNKNIFLIIFFVAFNLAKIQAQISVSDSTKKNDDFSNRVQVDLTGLSYVYSEIKNSTIVVLNKKEILSIDSKKFKSLTNEMIISIDIIEDKRATTEIKTIIFIQTK